ncbi:MAG: phthiocerol/phenolphthiocerol synthesis type-I polyketide synthase [Actinomycetota bacterium]|nr:phthiocerol/phenolphthiocerol synthesis type-I polyketide synthase [Actinomycetota bacterium]
MGMAGRFPDAPDIGHMWRMLMEGESGFREFKRDELIAAGVAPQSANDPDYVPVGTEMPGVDMFDATYFGINPDDAELIDPQQRVFLECVTGALNDAACTTTDRVAVFAGSLWSTYLFANVAPSRGFPGHCPPKSVMIANDKDFLCTRTSYRLGLTGPSVSVQTACSTSMVAMHLGCQALRTGDCDVVVAGGVGIFIPQPAGYFPTEDPTFSRDGRCRPFDAEASGMMMGNGCAVVILKRLVDAVADRDRIYAVVRGSAVGNDGSAKVGYAAPSVVGFRTAIRSGLDASDVDAAAVGYVEMHGSGTWMGDAVELRALSDVYKDAGSSPRDRFIGSVKANYGNLAMAGGATALIKTALILHNQTIPPQAGFDTPHPLLGLNKLPFDINTSAIPADLEAAAVTSTGGGGTNVHAVLERAPTTVRNEVPRSEYVVGIAAPDAEGLVRYAQAIRTYLGEFPDTRLDDLTYTMATGRRRLPHRHAFVARSVDELSLELDRYLAGETSGEHPAALAWTEPKVPDQAQLGPLEHARHISAPSYPLDPQRHWIDAT